MSVPSAAALIRERIATAPDRRMPWRDVMELALYDADAGYYRREVRRIGRGGDFFTSVSVGPVFGELAADFCARVCRAGDAAEPFAIIEQGANDGRLAFDVLTAMERDHADVFQRIHYWIVEPSPLLRAAQAATLGAKFAPLLRHAENLEGLADAPARAIFLGNELLDAFPTHRVCWQQGAWHELYAVRGGDDALVFEPGPLSTPALAAEVAAFPTTLPSGHTVDVNVEMLAWLRQIAETPFSGVVWLLDYGLTEAEFFAEHRSEGTLRRYHQHQMDDRVLENLGDCDLTTHVPFTRLARAAEAQGLRLLDFVEQGRFLTRLAARRLTGAQGQPNANWIRQFQTLTHPNHLGMSFHSLVLGKGADGASTLFSGNEIESARRRLGV